MTNLEKYIKELSDPKSAPFALRSTVEECQACIHNALNDADCIFEYEPPEYMGQYVNNDYCFEGTISWMNDLVIEMEESE